MAMFNSYVKLFDKKWLEPTETGAQPKKNGDVNHII